MNTQKIDLHLNLQKEAFSTMEKLRQKKSRTAFIEDLIKEMESLDRVFSILVKIKANQKRIFALLFLTAVKLGISEDEIQKTIENKEEKDD